MEQFSSSTLWLPVQENYAFLIDRVAAGGSWERFFCTAGFCARSKPMEDYFRVHHPEGELFIAPLDVILADTTVIQPDLFFVSGGQKEMVKDTHIAGAPQLVIEIISPSTGSRDRVQKASIYKNAGVQHYWLVNPGEKTLECFALRGGDYYLAAAGLDRELLKHPHYPDLAVDLAALWPGCS